MIYLDNSATTKPYKEVIESFVTVTEKFYGNPSSLHKKGLEAEKLIDHARQVIGKIMGVLPEEIIFTSGGTEGNNMAIKGAAYQYKQRGNHIITTEIEHPSSLEALHYLEQNGFRVTYLPVNEDGVVSLEAVEEAISDDTILLSMIHVNNEIGAIQPVEKVGALLRKHPKIIFHVDHVQGATKVPLAIRQAGIDLCTISGHKLHGLKGTGALLVRDGLRLTPLLHGGGQEKGYRSGTENVAGIVAFAKALRMSDEQALEKIDKLHQCQQYIAQSLEKIEDVVVNTAITHSAPHIVNFSVLGFKPEVIVHALAEEGISISTKSACSSKQNEASYVVLALGASEERALTALRVSLSFETTMADCKVFIETLRTLLEEQKKWIGGS